MSLRSRAVASAALAATMILVGNGQADANPLVNSGFETGDFTGWTVGGTNGGSGVALDGSVIPGTQSPFGTVTLLAHSGNYAAYGVVASTQFESLILSQTVNLTPGSYNVG